MSTIRVDRITPYQSGSVAIEGLNITNLTIDGTLTASLQQGYVWVGGSGNVSTLAPTSSFGGGGGGSDITALNAFTQSADGRLDNLELTTASLQAEVDNLQSVTGSYATTGSNTFYGTNLFSGSLSVSGSLTISGSTTQVGNQRITGSVNISGSTTQVGDMILTGSLTISGSSTFRNIGPTILSGSVDISGSINSDGYELVASSTSTIPVLNSTFNLNLSGSDPDGFGAVNIQKALALGDGKVLIAGRFQSIDGHTTNDIARLNSNGTIDTSFTSPGFSNSDFGDYYGTIHTFVTQSDGKILVGGDFNEVSGSARTGLARLNSNGTLDISFVTQSWGSFGTGEVRDIAIQNDDKIVVVGYFTSGSRRINTDGTLDTSYNVSTGSNNPSFFNTDYFYSVALLNSGSEQAILIGGNFGQWGSFSDYNNLVKLNPNGTLDFGFAGTNLAIDWNSDGWTTGDKIKKIKVTDAYSPGDNGYIYITGRFKDTRTGPNVRNAGFARLTTEDEGFGRGAFDSGFRTYISGSDQNLPGVSVYVNDFDFYDSDKILLGGNFITFGIPGYSTTSANRFAIVDQNDGFLVSNWSTDVLASKYNLNTGSVNSVTLLPNDNVLVGGTFTSASSPQTAREGLASLKLTGFGNVTTTTDYSITADTTQLLISSSNTYFSGDVNISGNLTASIQEGYVLVGGAGDVSKLTPTSSFGGGGDVFPYIGNAVISGSITISGSILQTGVGEYNIFIGSGSGVSNTSGSYNTFVGVMGGNDNTTGDANTFIGTYAGLANTTGAANTFVGSWAAMSNTTGYNNSVLGNNAAERNSTGYGNTFIGNSAGNQNTTGFYNTFIGISAGYNNITGNYNVGIGTDAGSAGQTNTSVFIGYEAQPQSTLQSNQIVIGNSATGNGSNTTTIGNSSTTATYLRGALNLTHRTSPHIMSGSLNMSGSINVTSAVTASSFTGSFVGDGSGLTGIPGVTPIQTGSFAVTGSNTFKAEQTISSSLIVTDIIKGTGSIFLQPDLNDSRDFRIYNTAPSDIHIKGNAAYSFFGDDTNYLKIDDNTGITSIVGVNGVVVSGSLNASGSNTFIGNQVITGSVRVSGSSNITGAVTASSFTGSFVGDGSGLTGVGSALPSDILSSSVTNFTDYSQSVDTRISSIVTGTGFATTGSNTFVGNQIVTGSLTLSSSAAVELRVIGDSVLSGSLTVTGSITLPGSGSLVNFVANPSTMRSIRGNGAGLYNITEQSDGNVTFTVTRIGTNELTAAITSNISGSTITGSFSDNTTTTSGAGRGARLRGFISGGVVTSVQIDTSNSSLGYEEYGQPASRQGIGYKAGDTLTIAQSLNQVTGSLTITLRQQDIDTYFGIDPRVSFDYKQYGILTARAGIITSGSVSIGAGVNTLGSINSIAVGTDVNAQSNYSIAVGRDLYNDDITAYANATFGMHHSSSNYAQTIVGIASRLDDTGEGAFVVGNGTTSFGDEPDTRSNLLVAQGNKVQITGSLDVSGNGYVILSKVSASYNYADDTAAQAGGVPLGGLYHTSGSVKIRLV